MTRRLGAVAALFALALVGCPPALAAASFGGVWKLLPVNPPADAPVREAVLTLKQEGEKITGTLTAREKELPIEEVTLQGNDLRFKVSAEREGVVVSVSVKVTIDGDTLKGAAEGATPEPLAFTGARQPAASAAITGTWNVTVEAPDHTYKPTVTLTQEGEKLTGTLRTEEGTEAKLVSGSVKGDVIAFVVDLTVGEQDLHLEFSGKRSETGLKGELRVGDRTFPWSGERAATTTVPAK